jgi:hypothetical protein
MTFALPMFTWGLLRSKAVARPRAATLLLKTWWTGLTAVGRSREDRLVRAKRFNEREMLDILVQLTKTMEEKERQEETDVKMEEKKPRSTPNFLVRRRIQGGA